MTICTIQCIDVVRMFVASSILKLAGSLMSLQWKKEGEQREASRTAKEGEHAKAKEL